MNSKRTDVEKFLIELKCCIKANHLFPEPYEGMLSLINRAIKAVKKQKPRKVLYEDVGYDPWHSVNVYVCICPCCGLRIFEFTDDDINGDYDGDAEKMFHSCLIHHDYRGLNNYCNRCGQKLDWSVSNE